VARAIQSMMAIVMGVISVWVVMEVVNTVDTSGWSTLVATLVGTIIPAIAGIGVLFLALSAFGVIGGRN